MRWTKTLIPTLREAPQEAEIASHILMIRAGLMRKLSSGLYTFLPLGLRALSKVERIVREEMDRAGALEILMPILQPRELWEKSGRFGIMGEIMLRAKSRSGRELVLGPTHEEVVTDLVAHEIDSYRGLPVNLYQIAPKIRDEIRPRFGLIRSREFIMKDGYSFDLDDAGAAESYQKMYDAYIRIFARCGLQVRVVEADTGVMGGNLSHEFMVPAESGEDYLASCAQCGYAANTEKAALRPSPDRPSRTAEPIASVDTPNSRTVEELAAFFQAGPERFIKTLIYVADGTPVAVLVRGDRDVNEGKLARLLGATQTALADEKTIEKATGAPLGFAGPVGLAGIRVVADYSVASIADGITGANQKDKHLVHVNLERDCAISEFHDLAVAAAGDLCGRCGAPLSLSRGVEVGHTFKLGTKYSRALGAMVKTEKGEEIPAVMGCYGIGVSRVVAAIVEQSHDAKGIVWPVSVAPYQVLVQALNQDDEKIASVASALHDRLEGEGWEVLYDDRPVSAGVKFNDADLVGIPLRITIGRKFLKTGELELKRRDAPAAVGCRPEDLTATLKKLLAG
jgi:prolyl-tRNA synthetase